MLKLADGGVGIVRTLAETGSIGNPKVGTIQASVAGQEGARTVLETGRRGFFKLVVEELRTVGHPELDGFSASSDGVVGEDVILRPSRSYYPRFVRPVVCVHVVSEGGSGHMFGVNGR